MLLCLSVRKLEQFATQTTDNNDSALFYTQNTQLMPKKYKKKDTSERKKKKKPMRRRHACRRTSTFVRYRISFLVVVVFVCICVDNLSNLVL